MSWGHVFLAWCVEDTEILLSKVRLDSQVSSDAVSRASWHENVSFLKLSLDFLQKDLRAPDVVIGADTIVVSLLSGSPCGGHILGNRNQGLGKAGAFWKT